ncbi:MAG: FecCD family ABC transporter permease [Erysipelotrichaceae bacterium]
MKTKPLIQTIKNKKALILSVSFLLLVVVFITSLLVGAADLSLRDVTELLIQPDPHSALYKVFYYVRLPRSLAALTCGVGLAVSGVLLQTLLNNPMCSPSIIGVNAGAGLFMIVIVAFFPTFGSLAPIAAFLGALAATGIVYVIANRLGASKLTIVLAGLAVSNLLGALIDTIVTIVPDAKVGRVDFMIGSFAGITMEDIAFVVPFMLVALLVVFLIAYDINVFSLGESVAASLGVATKWIKGLMLVCASILAGGAISLCGLVGFVGLIVPHIAKLFIGHDQRSLLPLCALMGGTFALFCDVLSRVLFIPFEVPVGIVMSLVGAPFFIYLILNRRKGRLYD